MQIGISGVTAEERDMIRAAAKRDRRTMSDFIRLAVFDKIAADNEKQNTNGHSRERIIERVRPTYR